MTLTCKTLLSRGNNEWVGRERIIRRRDGNQQFCSTLYIHLEIQESSASSRITPRGSLSWTSGLPVIRRALLLKER